MTDTYSSYLAIAKEAAQEASALVLRSFRTSDRSATEKADKTLVTETDTASERAIVEVLNRHTPTFGIYAEEEATGKRGRKEYTWIIDPLDGTHNFHFGVPYFAVQIALEHKGKIVTAVTALPTEGIILTAIEGHGCFANDQRVHVSKRPLKEGLLLMETYWDATDRKILDAFALEAHGMSVLNSASSSIAYIAMGRADVFIDRVDKPWDTAAGCLLVQEAGGKVTNLQGKPFDVYESQCVASNGVDHDRVISLLHSLTS